MRRITVALPDRGRPRYFRSDPIIEQRLIAYIAQEQKAGRVMDISDAIREALRSSKILFPEQEPRAQPAEA